MKRNKLLIFALSLVFCFSLALVGCGNEYNAEFYANAKEWIGEEFIKENRVCAAYFVNEDFVDCDDTGRDFVWFEDAPRTRTFIVADEETFESIFTKYDGTVDFENEMVLLHIFDDEYPHYNYSMKRITVSGGKVAVRFKVERPWSCIPRGDASMPRARYLMIKMNRVDIDTAEFIRL